MPPEGDYLFTNTGFSNDQPVLSLSHNDRFYDFNPLGHTLTLTSTFSQRHCTGWRDITTGERTTCPSQQIVDSKYDQCGACQRLTGFNPAFYHATTVSPQQQARNQQPHILYLAYFGGDIIKVGISHAARGNNRLLEQGARSALVLATCPTAIIARQYEAKIAAMANIVETVTTSQKIKALTNTYDAQKLLTMQEIIQAHLGVEFDTPKIIEHDSVFFPSGIPQLNESTGMTNQAVISGVAIGMLGSILFTTYQDMLLFYSVKKFVGYNVSIRNTESHISLPARQMGLF